MPRRRFILAVVSASALFLVSLYVLLYGVGIVRQYFLPAMNVAPMLVVAVAISLVASVIVAVSVSHWSGARETRCPKCNHILRGLTEPRCPECGETV